MLTPAIPLSKSNKAVKAILAATFPEYKGRKVMAEVRPTMQMWDTGFGDGTKSVYKVIEAEADGVYVQTSRPFSPCRKGDEGRTVELSETVFVVEHIIFCGKDYGIRIYVHPDLAPKMIAAPAA